MLRSKDMLGLRDITKEEINLILQTTAQMKKIVLSPEKKCNLFEGKSMVTMFFENSTRTKSSFELACAYLGGSYSSLNLATSSINKGETLLDTALTLDHFAADVMVVRHGLSGAPHLIADKVKASVINAGDGMNEHPTQALLDMFTMQEEFGSIENLEVAILGDIKHSRVARSNIWGLTKMGAKIRLYGPDTLIPLGVDRIANVRVCDTLTEAVAGADVLMGLRLQLERMQKGLVPSEREYRKFFGIDEQLLQLAKPKAIVMHPGPVNRDVEIASELICHKQSVINKQVTNGVAVRMALMHLLTGGRR